MSDRGSGSEREQEEIRHLEKSAKRHNLEQEFRKLPTPTSTSAGELARAKGEEQHIEKQEKQQQFEKAAGEHKRDETIRNIIGCGMYVLAVLIFFIIICAVGMLGYHLLVPTKHHLLDSGELQRVKDFVISGTIVGLGTSYFRRYMETIRK